jgi:phosphatidylglycerol lysyltransferase
VLYEWTGIMFWTVALAATMAMTRRTHAPRGDAAAARALLVAGDGSSLSWMTTWAGNSYWFAEHGRAAVAYRVIGGVAMATGEPFGHRDDLAAAARAFARYCAEYAWIPCFYGIGAVTRDALGTLGWASTQVAEETVVPLAGLAFTGRRWQDVRTSLNKARRAGVVAEFVTFNGAPPGVARQIRALSEEWVAGKDLPEMGFTLGGLDELADEEVRCVVARDADGTVVTSFLPVYESGAVVGWTLDFMRRREDAVRGVSEFLIASAALRFQEEGAAFVSLSGAPLARRDRVVQTGSVDRLLDLSSRALEPAYGFRSLLAFKAKFQPDYRPLYMSYPDATALPAIGTALTRAYLPDPGTARVATLIRWLCRRGS